MPERQATTSDMSRPRKTRQCLSGNCILMFVVDDGQGHDPGKGVTPVLVTGVHVSVRADAAFVARHRPLATSDRAARWIPATRAGMTSAGEAGPGFDIGIALSPAAPRAPARNQQNLSEIDRGLSRQQPSEVLHPPKGEGSRICCCAAFRGRANFDVVDCVRSRVPSASGTCQSSARCSVSSAIW